MKHDKSKHDESFNPPSPESDEKSQNPDTERAERRARQVADARSRLIGELRSGEPPSRQITPPTTRQSSTGLTAFIYCRVSTREQARTGGGEEGYSIPAQREAGQEKARQLNAAVTGVYIDAGESAKTANRPDLQRMLRDVKKQRPTYLIVHKIDRLARNREDDIAINLALKKAGTTLVSCTENLSDSPSGRFLYNIMADMAQFYSDNLAQEVLKGLVAKARDGGTPYQAPLGYVHKREYLGGAMTSWVEIDPERAPLIRWAFEVYATGDWTVTDLHLALRQKGLTTRPTANKPARDLPLNSLYKLLRNPYYLGVVTYQGATYEGKHDALIDTELWLHVQDILAAHAHAGEKDRVHQHYLRGTIFCGQCGARLVFSRNQGNGGYYDYFVCTKKRTRSHNCPRPAIRLEKIEQGIAVFYSRFQLTPTATADIRLGVRADMAAEIADAHQNAERAQRRLATLQDERARLLQAHYANAVPLDLLKTEMARLTRAMTDAEREITTSNADLASSEKHRRITAGRHGWPGALRDHSSVGNGSEALAGEPAQPVLGPPDQVVKAAHDPASTWKVWRVVIAAFLFSSRVYPGHAHAAIAEPGEGFDRAGGPAGCREVFECVRAEDVLQRAWFAQAAGRHVQADVLGEQTGCCVEREQRDVGRVGVLGCRIAGDVGRVVERTGHVGGDGAEVELVVAGHAGPARAQNM